MIQERNQGIVQAKRTIAPSSENTRERRLFRMPLRIPVRCGVSPRVIEAAKRLMQEYKADLDYLKDR